MRMKTMRSTIMTGLALLSLVLSVALQAQTTTSATTPATTPATVLPDDKDGVLKGLPAPVVTLLVSFDKTRDKYLAQQRLLLVKLKDASTPEERDAIRQKLETNRDSYLAELKDFRTDLRTELSDLKGKISTEERDRIVAAAREIATEGGLHHHKAN
jgi:hypothetical protein